MDDQKKEEPLVTVTASIDYLPYCDADIQEIFIGKNHRNQSYFSNEPLLLQLNKSLVRLCEILEKK